MTGNRFSGGRPFKLLQDRGQTFRDGLLDGIQLRPAYEPAHL